MLLSEKPEKVSHDNRMKMFRMSPLKRHIDGLLHECELLSVEIARLGAEPEYAAGANGQRVDITDVWRIYLQGLLSTKLRLIARLQARRARLDRAALPRGPSTATADLLPHSSACGNRTSQSE
jgi:hypothetical protein